MALNKTDLKEINKLLVNQDRYLDEKLLAQDKRLDEKLLAQDKRLDEKLAKQRKAINEDMGDLITDQLIPQIDEVLQATARIEKRLDKIEDKIDTQNQRIVKLEKIHPAGKHLPAA